MSTAPDFTTLAQPFTSPLYGGGPYHYRDYTAVYVSWTTTAQAAASVLPPGVRPRGENPVLTAGFSEYGVTAFGPYHEFMITIDVVVDADDGSQIEGAYAPYLYVDSEVPLAVGRELWGYCKKLGAIELGQQSEVVWATLHRPAALPLAYASFVPREVISIEDTTPAGVPLFSLRVVPSTDPERYGPDVAQLIQGEMTSIPRVDADGVPAVWKGDVASLTFPAQSAADPIHAFPVVESLGGMWGTFDAVLAAGTVVKNYLR